MRFRAECTRHARCGIKCIAAQSVRGRARSVRGLRESGLISPGGGLFSDEIAAQVQLRHAW
eukprot:366841-Rhodomonas_salina.6